MLGNEMRCMLRMYYIGKRVKNNWGEREDILGIL